MRVLFSPDSLINPHSLWSLWVPGVLLGLILVAAAYFIRASTR